MKNILEHFGGVVFNTLDTDFLFIESMFVSNIVEGERTFMEFSGYFGRETITNWLDF